jgi:hypothetical protein
MRSIYESAREVMEAARGGALPNQPNFLDRLSNALSPSANRKRAEAQVAAVNSKAKEQNASNTLAAANMKAKEQNASNSLTSANSKAKPLASLTSAKPAVKPAAKPATMPGQATMAPAPSQDKLNATQRSAEKSGPDTDSMKKGIAAGAPAAAEAPKPAAAPEPEKLAAKTPDSGSGYTGSGVKVEPEEKPQAAMTKSISSSERQDVKDGSGNTVKDGSGNAIKTRSADEIGDTDTRTGKVTPGSFEKNQQQGQENLKKLKGMFGMKESNNKKFNVSDALYQSVMEVMKKDKGSVPRNEKEKDLAAFHGDPKRITHGDVLKARGVTKEEAEPVDEMSSKMKMKLGLYGKKKKTNEESVDEGMGSAAKSMAKKVLSKMGGGSDKDQLKDLQKKMGMPQTGKKPMKENKDTPGNGYAHQCAIHVKSESFGEGRTITTQHANPDAYGNIEWYDVMFEHGIEKQVPTDSLEILVSEMHMHSKKKKAM